MFFQNEIRCTRRKSDRHFFNSWMQWTSLCGNSVSLAPSYVNGNFNYMHDCLLNQSEANGPRLDHMMFLLSACRIFYRQRESVDPTEMRSDFGLLGWILNIDSPENCITECSVQFIFIQHQAVQKERIWKWSQLPLTTAVVRREWESFTVPCALFRSISTVVMNLLFAMDYMQWQRTEFSDMWSWGFMAVKLSWSNGT